MDDFEDFSDDDLASEPVPLVQPYQFEPIRHSDEETQGKKLIYISNEEESEGETDEEAERPRPGMRTDNLAWCDCGTCIAMPTNTECVCCQEIGPVETILTDSDQLTCITQHEGFQGNCLNRYVIQVSLLDYVQMEGPIDDNEPIHELYRHIAYRRFTRWIWFRLGKGRRKVIPACAVQKIRETFPSEQYTGFQYPRP